MLPLTTVQRGHPPWRDCITPHSTVLTGTGQAARLPGFKGQLHHLKTMWLYLVLYKVEIKSLNLVHRVCEMLRTGPAKLQALKNLSRTMVIWGSLEKIPPPRDSHVWPQAQARQYWGPLPSAWGPSSPPSPYYSYIPHLGHPDSQHSCPTGLLCLLLQSVHTSCSFLPGQFLLILWVSA